MPSRQRGRADDDGEAPDQPAAASLGAEPVATTEPDPDAQGPPPAPQDEMPPPTTQQDTAMDASTITQTAQQTYDKLLGSGREHVEKANQAMIKSAEEMQKLSKENLEACIQASTIMAKGMQELGREWTAYLQESMDRSAAAAKALMAARTMQEVVSLQSDWVKASLDKLLAEATKLSEQTVKVTNEAMEPISARLSVAAETLNERLKMPLAA
jgi:phasin family protein